MFVQTESTPNPNSLKFLPGKAVSNGGSFEITKKDDVKNELIRNLMSVNGVEGIFLSKDFISINKYDETSGEFITLNDTLSIQRVSYRGKRIYMVKLITNKRWNCNDKYNIGIWLEDLSFNLDDNIVYVTNQDVNAVLNNEGFVSSLDNGGISRETNSVNEYL